MTGATVADPPSDMAFDPLGALLAVGTTHVRYYVFLFVCGWVGRWLLGLVDGGTSYKQTDPEPLYHHQQPRQHAPQNKQTHTQGAVRVYDFDEVLSAARHGLCATSRAAVVLGQGGGGRREAVHPLQVGGVIVADDVCIMHHDDGMTAAPESITTTIPSTPRAQVLEPRKAVSAVRWNPRRDSEVAVAFWHWAEVGISYTHASVYI